MYSIGLGLKLLPGRYDGYRKAHDESWPDLLENLRSHRVSMVIYRSGDRLFVHATAPSEAQWLATREGPRNDEWNRYMSEFLETDSGGDFVFEELEMAFSFGEFKSGDQHMGRKNPRSTRLRLHRRFALR